MDPQVTAALIQLGIHLVETVIVPLLARLIEGTAETPVTVQGVAREIVMGIERDWPQLSGPEKAQMAREAIEQLLKSRGGNPLPADVNWLMETAVQSLKRPKE